MRIAPLLVLLSVLAGCQITPSFVPLPVHDRFEVVYRGQVGPEPARLDPQWEDADVAAEIDPPPSLDPGTLGGQVFVGIRILRMKSAVANHLLAGGDPAEMPVVAGGGHLPAAETRERLEELVVTGLAVEMGAPSLLCTDGERAHMSVITETAYIEAFGLNSIRHAYIAEPRVGRAEHGIRMELRPSLGAEGDEVELEVALQVADLQRPIPTVRVPMADGTTTLQVPMTHRQELSATATVGSEDMVFLRGLQAFGEDSAVIAFVEARRVDESGSR